MYQANVAAANGAENDAEVLLSLIRNRPLKASGEHLWKVWPTNAIAQTVSVTTRRVG